MRSERNINKSIKNNNNSDINNSDNEENSNFNMPRKVKSGVGANSNLRRKSNEG